MKDIEFKKLNFFNQIELTIWTSAEVYFDPSKTGCSCLAANCKAMNIHLLKINKKDTKKQMKFHIPINS